MELVGGKVMGTRTMVDAMDCSPSSFQNGLLFRRISTQGRDNGIRNRPSFQMRCGGWTRADDNSGV
jgi:hypothetical protein